MQGNYAIIYLINQSGCVYSFLATIGFIAPDKILINSRRTGNIIWIIKIIRKPHHTVYKQNALSCGSRQQSGSDEIGFIYGAWRLLCPIFLWKMENESDIIGEINW